MKPLPHSALSRRSFLAASAAAGAALPFRGALADNPNSFVLRAAQDRARLVPESWGETDIWCYGGTVPGPEIRIRQGERLRIEVENALNEETTVHWHGVRVPNAMDGVPHLTQQPIAPGGRFTYEFDAMDAGTFWYHPHQRSFEQVGRGLYGALIIEEAEPPRVDRDLVWVLDDWRLTEEAEIAGGFGGFHDKSHAGRLGNTVTINGRVPDQVAVRGGERIRLRLINAANARIFALDFGALTPQVIALDGQPVAPHAPGGRGWVLIGPAMRVDLILDMTGAPGERVTVSDRFHTGNNFQLVDLTYADEPLRDASPDWPVQLSPNPLPEPDLNSARRHEVTFTGGMMGGMAMREMGITSEGRMMGNDMMGMMHGEDIWFVNGTAARGHILDPLLVLERNRSHVVAMTNATAFHHPIHLHGHSFRLLSRNGQPTTHREWQDTVLMAPREQVEIAFVADNPGDWMFHCHILEHQAGGMMGVIRVA
ncbi:MULTISPECIES: multicopper oxidase family protein [Leisingera]|jgi:FtsP/CotA-like multicopper oxidase with cupredoxin domain|uniref:multicopper oxidase family protein n=1 Tax=Leisingera TaxID=191028 RepID=UPI000AFAA26B|nr:MULTISPECIES: multicopper oxidase family protein [Leisingera]QDI74420.1 multicopper oxidase family protein [Leisingera aquaemixtae]